MRLSVSMNRDEVNIGWAYLALQLLVLPLLLVTANSFLRLGLTDAELNFTMFSMEVVLSLVIFRKFLWESAKVFLRNLWRNLRFAVWGFGIYYIGTFLVNMGTTYLFPAFSNMNDENILTMVRENHTLMSIGLVFFVPLTEELLYRGLIFGRIHKKSRWLAYLVSMVSFAAIHVLGYVVELSVPMLLVSLVQYLPAAFALAWAYERTDTIWTSILIHMTVNQIAIGLQ